MTATATPTVPRGLLVGGEWSEAAGGRALAVEDPATGATIAHVADGAPEDALAALDAAHAASAAWAAGPPRERAEILRRAYDAVTARADEFAALITAEMGKPLAEARAEVAYGAEFLRWFGEESVRVHGRYARAPAGGGRIVTARLPVGPCLLVTPWNFPLAMGTRKIAPAVAAGCTMILKPAKQTPLTSLLLGAVLHDSGLPPGVLNVITTSSAGPVVAALMADRRLRKVSFTGSTDVGRTLIERSARHVLRLSLELGGNAPFIVLADADLDAALEGAMLAKLRNGGEACTAANRFLVHRSLAGEFAARLAQRMRTLTVGPGAAAGVEVGPLIDGRARDDVHALVQDAVGHGATVVTGGAPIAGPGYFYAPTVLTVRGPQPRLLHEEIFGPVAPIVAFEDEEEAVALANDTEYGLVAYLYTRDLAKALALGERLEAGMVGVNRGIVSDAAAPFGGVKASGLGREGGPEGIDEYLETRYLALTD